MGVIEDQGCWRWRPGHRSFRCLWKGRAHTGSPPGSVRGSMRWEKTRPANPGIEAQGLRRCESSRPDTLIRTSRRRDIILVPVVGPELFELDRFGMAIRETHDH